MSVNYKELMIYVERVDNSEGGFYHLCLMGLTKGLIPIRDKAFTNAFKTEKEAIEKVIELKGLDLKIQQ